MNQDLACRLPIDEVSAAAYRIPTRDAESDATYCWSATTLVVVQVRAGDVTGMGYTYADAAAAVLVQDTLGPALRGRDALATRQRWLDMACRLRNVGAEGLGEMALSAIDIALWDLRARWLQCPLVTLLGAARDAVPVYGSGGFTSQDIDALQRQLGGWAERGFERVKMKVGRHPRDDLQRVMAARQAIGPEVELFMDANGAYSANGDRKQALAFAWDCAELDVRWFEEPVSSDDLEGLRLMRDQGPPAMAVSAGEYGYRATDFLRLLQAGAVDVLQADATRCGGVTGFMDVAALCRAWQIPLSSHCAPALHLPLCCAAPHVAHLEYFDDHARIEHMLFDGATPVRGGMLAPDLARPGLGLQFKEKDARCYSV